jgi:hypothetical protein
MKRTLPVPVTILLFHSSIFAQALENRHDPKWINLGPTYNSTMNPEKIHTSIKIQLEYQPGT